MKEPQKPIHEIRLGAIKAAIWENRSEANVWHSVTVTRLYKEGEKWNQSTSFGREDLLLVGKVLDLAHTWVFETTASKEQNK